MFGSIFTDKPSGNQPATVMDALDMPHFNAMYEGNPATASSQFCEDSAIKDYFQKAVVNDVIRCSNYESAPDLNFFENAWGMTEIDVEAKEIYARYDDETGDRTIYFAEGVEGSGPGVDATATILRGMHSADGKFSSIAKSWSLVDPDTNEWIAIEDKNTDNDFAHRVLLRPYQAGQTVVIKKHKKYTMVPARLVGGYSCPLPTNKMPKVGYMRSVKPVRLRRDWSVKFDINRGYRDELRWTLLWDQQGNSYDAWDAYQAQEARYDLQLARNVMALLGTPITNSAMINGVGVTSIDNQYTGFFGLIPSIRNAGGNVIDYDSANGLDITADLEPFMLSQDAVKNTTAWNIRCGQTFKARFSDRASKMLAKEGLAEVLPGWKNNAGVLEKTQIEGYRWMGKTILLETWSALSDSRLVGTPKMDETAIMSPVTGLTDDKGAAVPPVQFFQPRGKSGYNGGYVEETVNLWKTTLCEELRGSVVQTLMMRVNCPGRHILINPMDVC